MDPHPDDVARGRERRSGASVPARDANVSEPDLSESCAEFAEILHRLGALQFGSFTLKDGSTSPVYCDLRLLISDPEALRYAGRLLARLLEPLRYDRIAAIPYAGLPLGTAAALEASRALLFPRKEAKGYGQKRAIEGAFEPGDTVVLLDDLISRGTSKLEVVGPLRSAGLGVADIVVLVDRRPAGSTDMEEAGLRVHAAFTLRQLAEALASRGKIDEEERRSIEEFLAG